MPEPTIFHDRSLDARGLNCPLPILHARRELDRMNAGEVLRIVSTDPGAARDFEKFARLTGHQLVGASAADGEYVVFLRHR